MRNKIWAFNFHTHEFIAYYWLLEVIIDYGSAFVTYENEIESKGVQFPGRDAPDKISGEGGV